VDASCPLTKDASVFIKGVGNLYASYATCGELDAFSSAYLAKSIEGQTLRIHALNEPPNVYSDRGEDHPVGRGLVWDLYTEMFKSAGAFTERYDLQPYNGSAWSACIDDVAMGYLDVCLGTFWETAERRELVTFITPFAPDNFFLVVKNGEINAKVNYWGVFDPFAPRLWACIVALIVFISVLIFFLERPAQGPDHPHFSGENVFEGAVESTYLACIGFWSGGVAHESVTPGGRMVTLAFGIFVILTLAGYTANLASSLVARQIPPASYSNLYDVVKAGEQLCMWGSVYSTFVANHPQAALQVIQVSSTEEAMANLDQGICKGVINSDVENMKVLSKSPHCDKSVVGGPVMTLMLSQPVNIKYYRVLSYLLLKKAPLKAILEQKYAPVDHCPPKTTIEKSSQMDIDDFYGTFIVTGVATFLGLLIRLVRWVYARYQGKSLFEGSCTEEQPADATIPATARAPGSAVEEGVSL
jgi:ABC-type amino acid transport substrate-binding protein